MTPSRELPREFVEKLRTLEASYLAEEDPIRQSGFGGGPVRWRAEREPLLDAVESDGDFLDVGSASGYLLECLVAWGRERGVNLVPYGLDIGEQLIELAKLRLPQYASNFFVGNAWNWDPPRPFRYVYTLHDCVPPDCLDSYIRRLLAEFVEPGGRLIVGSYGSKSRGVPPFDVPALMASIGLSVAGTAMGGFAPVPSFTWVDAPARE